MPRRRFDKKSAVTYNVVHRAHDDAHFYDNEVSEHVLVPAPSKQSEKKTYNLGDLEEKLGKDQVKLIRDNEGLAAQYGIYFDDTNYDYMQHLKPMGEGDIFVEAKGKGKQDKTKIEDLFKEQLPSEETRKVAFDASENIPHELQGFNPEMDPRLREVLEALDDEAYVEEEKEEEDDFFENLIKSGEAEEEEFDDYYQSDEDREWDLDNYDDLSENYNSDAYEEQELPYNEGEAPDDILDQPAAVINTDWQRDFNKFKSDTKNKANDWDSDDDFEEEDDFVPELPNASESNKKISNSKMRKKKGAATDTTSFSMSSSANFRTDGLTLLDDRFEQLSKKFNEDPEEEYKPFSMKDERNDLEGMLDDFLDNYEVGLGGRKLVKKDAESKKLQQAADSVSKGKAALKRKKENEAISKLGGSFGKMSL